MPEPISKKKTTRFLLKFNKNLFPISIKKKTTHTMPSCDLKGVLTSGRLSTEWNFYRKTIVIRYSFPE